MHLIVTSFNRLTLEQKEEVINLENLAFERDGLENHGYLSNEINFDKEVPCFYLCHEEGKLIGFLTIFMPTRQEAEIMAVTHPQYQKQGVFSVLLKCAKEELRKNQVEHILYCVEPKSNQARYVLEALHVSEISHSEYRMTLLQENALKDLPVQDNLYVKKVCLENASDFVRMRIEAFGKEEEDHVIEEAIASENRRGYLLYDKITPVGEFVMGYEDETFIYGVAIDKAFRGKGYGKYLVQKAIELGLERGRKIALDVDSMNPIAMQLYKKCGFEITFQVDYYRGTI